MLYIRKISAQMYENIGADSSQILLRRDGWMGDYETLKKTQIFVLFQWS